MKKDWKQPLIEKLTLEGYTLLTELTTQKAKVWVICPQKHQYALQAQGLVNGHRCSKCANKEQSTKKYLTEWDVVKRLDDHGYLLASPYTSYLGTVTLICPHGKDLRTDIKQFTLGKRCKCKQ